MCVIQDSSEIKQLNASDFEEAFGDKFGDKVQQRIAAYGFEYEEMSLSEHNEVIRNIVGILLAENVEFAGEHRRDKWEKGWGENLSLLQATSRIEAIKPKYFEKYQVLRWKQKFIKPISKNFEANILAVIEEWLFEKYMQEARFIYEFGCGTGHNLVRLREFNADATLWGLDWVDSSQKLIREIAKQRNDAKFFGHKFDYFAPDTNFTLEKDAVVFTVASLEQVGDRFKPFVQYLLQQKPKLCIHIEPIVELLDENDLLDYLSVEYFKKRKYLTGFLPYLQLLEKQNKVKIINAQRTYTGSMYIEGCSVIVWMPV